MAEADPQASVLAKISGLDIATVQTALTIFVALLIEVGSGFGMYVAFAYWRLHDRKAEPGARDGQTPTAAHPAVWSDDVATPVSDAEPVEQAAQVPARRGANDNRTPVRPLVPESDVQRYYRERVVAAAEHASLTSSELYEEYCRWCEENERIPFAHPRVTREIGELGVKKERIGKRTRYFGIALRSANRTRGGQEAADTISKSSIGRKAN